MKTIAKTLNKARYAIFAVLAIGVLGFMLTSLPSQAEEDTQVNSSESQRRINPDPDACGVSLSLPKFLCVNDDDDQEPDSEYYEEWDWKHEPSPGDDDLKQVTVTGTAGKGGGTLTISILEGGDKIGGKFWKDGEKEDEETERSWPVPANSSVTKTFFIEGQKHSDKEEDVSLKAVMVCAPASDGSSTGGYDEVIEKTTVYHVDMDVDSDNENKFEFAGFTDEEDKIENSDKVDPAIDKERPGKVVINHSRNYDGDDYADIVDGYTIEEGTGGYTDPASVDDGLKFVPVRIELKEPFDPDSAYIKLNYAIESKPLAGQGVEKKGSGTATDPYYWEVTTSGLRLWRKNPQERSKGEPIDEGDFIPHDEEVKWSDIAMSGGGRVAKLYLEYVDQNAFEANGRKTINAKVREEEVICEDEIKVTLFPVDLDIDSDQDDSTNHPERDAKEEEFEDFGNKEDREEDETKLGKVLWVNYMDMDADGIPGYADGIEGVFEDDGEAITDESKAYPSMPFAQMILDIPDKDEWPDMKIKIKYKGSDPNSISKESDGEGGHIYTPDESGGIRLWKKDGDLIDEKRKPSHVGDGGDYVEPDTEFKPADLNAPEDDTSESIDQEDENEAAEGELILYVEAVHPSEKIAGETVTVWVDLDGDGPMDWVEADQNQFTCFDLALKKVKQDGSMVRVHEPVESMPAPEITVNQLQILEVLPSADGSGIVGCIGISGTLKSKGVSLSPTAVISEITLRSNPDDGVGDDAGSGAEVHSIAVSANKNNGDSYYEPHPYDGSFNDLVVDVKLTEGVNILRVSAYDPVSKLDAFIDYQIEVSATESGEPVILASQIILESLVSEPEDELPSESTDPAEATSYFDYVLTSTSPSETSKTGPGTYVAHVVQILGPEKYLETVEKIDLFDNRLNSQPAALVFAAKDGGGAVENFFLKLGKKVHDHQRFVVSLVNAGQGKAEEAATFIARETNKAVQGVQEFWELDKTEKGKLMDQALGSQKSFELGATHGFVSGGWDMVAGTVELVWNVGKYSFVTEAEDILVLVGGEDQALVKWKREVDQQMLDAYKFVSETLVPIIIKLKKDEADFALAVLTNDFHGQAEIAMQYYFLIETTPELMELLWDSWTTLPAYCQGYYTGYVLFEVASLVVSYTKAAKLGQAGKVGKVSKHDLLTDLKAKPFFNSGPGKQAVDKMAEAGGYLARLATTKMCFVEGTPIHTEKGLMPIEKVKPGMWVVSRDPETQKQGLKPVVQTFVTRPEKLYHLSFAGRGSGKDSDGEADTLVCTGEHPFWVKELKRFVPASELKPGQSFLQADGAEAYLIANHIQVAPKGEKFTTYNFEVADFHTYFAGESGVWVHNAGRACELAFSTWRRLFDKHSNVAVSYRQLAKIQKRKKVSQGAKEDTVWGLVQKNGEIDKLKTDNKLAQEIVDLGTEDGVFDAREAFVADRFKLLKGKNLTGRSDQGADFVETLADGTKRHWDAKGPFPGKFVDQQMDTILAGFTKHYRDHGVAKNEFLVVDWV